MVVMKGKVVIGTPDFDSFALVTVLIIGLSDCFFHTAISSSFSFVVVSIFLRKLVPWASDTVFWHRF
ncbi:hypothetical protein H5410_034305 [Solanum commersonii]|uniref:Transmembrane protein n=1 Tax=Solanum commersonii TaxID=4109 RepID=A0A9J5YT19_SOLCO|nr:hypothetical protein H5410_034305 [Solanum commersonii]